MSEARNEMAVQELELLEEKDRRIATLEASLHIQLGYKEAFLAAHTALVSELNLEISRLSSRLEGMQAGLAVSPFSRSAATENFVASSYSLN